jgi:hypothetical protein
MELHPVKQFILDAFVTSRLGLLFLCLCCTSSPTFDVFLGIVGGLMLLVSVRLIRGLITQIVPSKMR